LLWGFVVRWRELIHPEQAEPLRLRGKLQITICAKENWCLSEHAHTACHSALRWFDAANDDNDTDACAAFSNERFEQRLWEKRNDSLTWYSVNADFSTRQDAIGYIHSSNSQFNLWYPNSCGGVNCRMYRCITLSAPLDSVIVKYVRFSCKSEDGIS